MPLEYNELEPIIEEVLEKVRTEILTANRIGTLDIVLDKYDVNAALPVYTDHSKKGDTILVLGNLSIDKKDLKHIYKIFKVREETFEFVEYDDVTNFNFGKLIANTKYTDVFVGPVPHKARDIGTESGVIEYLKNESDITAKIAELRDSAGELKISKKTFKQAMEESDLINRY